MNKHKISLIYLVIISSIIFFSCEKKQNQVKYYSQDSKPEEYEKIEVRHGKKQYKVSLGYKINKQSKNEREFVEIRTSHLFKIGSINDTIFYYPTFVKSDNLGNIYVLDMQDCSVKKFNNKGFYTTKYGRKGKGPGEFSSPFRMDVFDNGQLLVLDPNLNKCEIFEGNKTKQFKLSISSHGACFIDSLSFATFQSLVPFDYSAIIKHNILDEISIDCQNLIYNNDEINLGPLPFLQGDILKTEKDGFMYVPMYMNHFVRYSKEGKIIYARNTIDDIKLPSIQKDNPNIVDFRIPKEYRSSLYAFVINDYFYNVSSKATIRKSSGIDYVIDVYSLFNGEYRYSFMLSDEEVLRNIYMDKERIYLLKDNLELEVLNYNIDE